MSIKSEESPTYDVDRTLVNQRDDETIRAAINILQRRLQRSENLEVTCTKDATDFLKLKLAQKEHEIFAILFLDNQHRLIKYEEMFRGTIDGASVYPREVVKAALGHNAAAVLFAHNHPSGVCNPSEADKKITARLKDACNLVDIRVLDHIVVGGTETASFAERGLL